MNKRDEMEIGRTIILASHSLLNDRKVLLKRIVKLKKENEKLKKQNKSNDRKG